MAILQISAFDFSLKVNNIKKVAGWYSLEDGLKRAATIQGLNNLSAKHFQEQCRDSSIWWSGCDKRQQGALLYWIGGDDNANFNQKTTLLGGYLDISDYWLKNKAIIETLASPLPVEEEASKNTFAEALLQDEVLKPIIVYSGLSTTKITDINQDEVTKLFGVDATTFQACYSRINNPSNPVPWRRAHLG